MQRRLRFRDLLSLGIVQITLTNWIRKRGFPSGQLTGPNTRTWSEAEVEHWLASRPVAPKPTPKPKRRVGRPRKADQHANPP